MDGAGELSAAPNRPEGVEDAEWIAILERENRTLRAVNAKLARERLGAANTAAAARLAGARSARRSPLGAVLTPLRKLRLLLRRALLRVLR